MDLLLLSSLPRTRRGALLAAAASLSWAAAHAAAPDRPGRVEVALRELADLETAAGVRLGVAATLPESDALLLGHRAEERFPLCSTFKLMLVAAVLARAGQAPGAPLLARHIDYGPGDLVTYSPVTQPHAGEGMAVADLCAAAIQHSDNTAANLLIKLLGGPPAVTAYARSIGDTAFRLDRWETDLNTALPGDPRDTSTPAAMAASLRRLALGDALPAGPRARLVAWLRGNTTGGARVRAGVPADWAVGDKTGTGDHGTTNDVAVIWPPGRPPITVAVYCTQALRDARPRDDLVAAAARCVARALG